MAAPPPPNFNTQVTPFEPSLAVIGWDTMFQAELTSDNVNKNGNLNILTHTGKAIATRFEVVHNILR